MRVFKPVFHEPGNFNETVVPPSGRTVPINLPEGAQEVASALKAVGREMNREFQISTQDGRFRIQKAVYLLKRLRYPAAYRFSYNLYLRGPYSPDLAKAYYALRNSGLVTASPANDIPKTTLSIIVEALVKDDSFLEGLATALNVSSKKQPFQRALSRAKAIKPNIESAVWGEVERFVKSHPRLINPT